MQNFDEHIKSALKKEVDFQLPDNFSEKIITLILARARRERRWELAGIITVATLFVAVLIITLILTDFQFSLGALTFLSDHIGLISFGVFFVLLLHVVDKKVIRKQQVG